MRHKPIPSLQIRLPKLIPIRPLAPIPWRLLRIVLTQPHSLRIILLIRSEMVIYPRRHNHQIVLLQLNAYPLVVLRPYIEEPRAVESRAAHSPPQQSLVLENAP